MHLFSSSYTDIQMHSKMKGREEGRKEGSDGNAKALSLPNGSLCVLVRFGSAH